MHTVRGTCSNRFPVLVRSSVEPFFFNLKFWSNTAKRYVLSFHCSEIDAEIYPALLLPSSFSQWELPLIQSIPLCCLVHLKSHPAGCSFFPAEWASWNELFAAIRPSSRKSRLLLYMPERLFSKFYRRHNELTTKFNFGLKSLLQQGLSEPEFYGDLVYKLKKIRGMTDFSSQFRKVIIRYKRVGYNLNVMRQSACLAINPIMVDSFAALFNCTPVDRASDSMMAPT